jgi:capsular exopolysaccharide synthesis family protein
MVSARPHEGRTSVCVGLALSSAHDYGRVLIVEVDLRRPSLHRRFQLPQLPGLSDHLFHGAKLEEALRATEVPGLSILPGGTAVDDTGAVLKSPEFHELMPRLQEAFDYIIFDTPPTLVVNDVVLLKEWVDSMVVLARAGRTRERDLDDLLTVLNGAGLRPSHTVLIGGAVV